MSKANNKFNFLRDRKGAVEELDIEVRPEEAAEQIVVPSAKVEEERQPQPDQPKKKMGRPRGKRSDPDYEQVTAYIRRDTYTATKIALLQENRGREFSELVEDLLSEYLSTQKFNNPKI